MADCVFCQKVKDGTALHDIGIWTKNRVLRFEPLNPVTHGHMLFIPAIHVGDASALPEVTGDVFAHAARYGQFKGLPFNLITSKGEPATQSIFHLHVHYVPRYANDGLHLPWTKDD
jgi:histidine triad (HIT) family protein